MLLQDFTSLFSTLIKNWKKALSLTENLLVTKDIIKIADFGLAHEVCSKPPYTEYVSTRWSVLSLEVVLISFDLGMNMSRITNGLQVLSAWSVATVLCAWLCSWLAGVGCIPKMLAWQQILILWSCLIKVIDHAEDNYFKFFSSRCVDNGCDHGRDVHSLPSCSRFKVLSSCFNFLLLLIALLLLFDYWYNLPWCSEADEMYKICTVIGTPNQNSWAAGLQLADTINFQFPQVILFTIRSYLGHVIQPCYDCFFHPTLENFFLYVTIINLPLALQ